MAENNELDLDYVIIAALLAGGITMAATAITLLARPALIDLGKQLPLPTVESLMQG